MNELATTTGAQRRKVFYGALSGSLASLVVAASILNAHSFASLSSSKCGNCLQVGWDDLTIFHPCLFAVLWGTRWLAALASASFSHWVLLVAGSTWFGCLLAMVLF